MRSRWHNAPRNEPCRAAVQGVPGRLSIAAATITTARYICCADRLRSSRSSGLSIVWKEEKNISKCSFVICNLLFLSSFFLLTLILLQFFFHLDAVSSAVACVPASAQRLFWMHIKLFLLHCVIISDRCMFRVVSWKMNQNCFNHEKFVISTHVLWVISSSFVKFHAISAAHPKPSIDEWCEHKATAHKWIMNTFIQMNVAKWS